MAVKDLTKGAALAVPSAPIPLKSVKLGTQSVSATFLRPLFAASTATLTALTLALNSRTTPSLRLACPIAFPHLVELNVETFRNEITSVERRFFPLLAGCVSLRSLGWEWADFYELDTVLRFLPDRGARLEHLGIGLFEVAAWAQQRQVKLAISGAELTSLREVRVCGLEGGADTDQAVGRFCRERRIMLQLW